VLVHIKSDGSERSSRFPATFGDGPSPVLLAGSPASRSVGDDGDDASPSITIAPSCEPTGLAHSPAIFSVHEHEEHAPGDSCDGFWQEAAEPFYLHGNLD